MIDIEKVVLPSGDQMKIVIEGMRNPLNSWARMDSGEKISNMDEVKCGFEPIGEFSVGENDKRLMTKLANAGPVHAKYRRMIPVFLTINAPLYWWKEFDTYKVGTVANSCSTMHKIQEKGFTLDDFSCEHLISSFARPDDQFFNGYNYDNPKNAMLLIITLLNVYRDKFDETNDKKYWWQMIQLLPSSYNQKRTVMLNYEVLARIYRDRKDHKLDEWRQFCEMIESLPYSYVIVEA